ncbi:hypothetical protein [Cellulomonas iranensis]|uniref:Uncharacterized protein n=1 Tax=Cellulomonas iranensis TaxID=76862 RepID=A0ABU0GGS9_9CELL|nr:hypothetical protein [Cellulomonas iranensis]MDQ0424298.1 hypothetical protein [Cellulomonas iranensis]
MRETMASRVRVLPVVVTVLVLGLMVPPAAAAAEAPDEVATWFAHEAPRVAGDVLEERAVDIDPSAVRTSDFAVGEPVALHRWSQEFVDGESLEPLVVSGEWAAPLYRDGSVVGTIAATLETGSVRFSYVDDDADAGRALAAHPSAPVVQDPRLGGLLAVEQDGAVEDLSRGAGAALEEVGDIQELRSAVLEAHEPDLQAFPADGGSGGARDDGGLRAAAGLVLVVGGLAALTRQRSLGSVARRSKGRPVM